jgi:soluble lytic murein transglycosylase-like protein
MMNRFLTVAVATAIFACASPARAELVFFSTGRTMSVKSHRVEGESLILTLRSGGEIVCDSTAVARFAPDEVPYPEPEVAAAAPAVEAPGISIQAEATAVPYGAIIDKVAAEQGVNAKLVRALVQVESAYQPRARSPKGAMGLMQLMPATARQYGVADPYDPVSNIEAGIKHLKSLLQRFPKSVALALAAYNAGEGAVMRFNAIPPYAETRNYVSRILNLAGL